MGWSRPAWNSVERLARADGGFPPLIVSLLVLFGTVRNRMHLRQSTACCMVLVWLVAAVAQDPPTAKPSPQDALSDLLPPGLRPDVMVLRDDQGNDILVPRTRYEEYERRLVEDEDTASEPQQPAGLSSLDVVVEPDKEYARVTVKASANLGRTLKTWQTIPIALGQLQWVPRAAADGEASPTRTNNPLDEIAVAPQSNGYLWRVRPGKETARTLDLSAVCKLTSSSGGYAVRFDLPPAATVIRLKLPIGDWELTATGGGNEVVEPFQRIDSHSVAIVRTTASTVTLSWNRKTEKDAVAAVEVTSQTKFSPTSDASVFRAVTSLAFRGPRKLGGKRFTLELPAGSVLREAATPTLGFPAYRLSRATAEGLAATVPPTDPNAPADPNAPVAWSLEFEESLSRSEIEIPMEWQWSVASTSPVMAFLVPNIDGAQRHTGTLECLVPRNVLFEWEPVGSVRLLRQSQSNDGSDSMSYSFQFDRPGAGVRGAWTSLASRPRLFSKQSIEVKDQQLQLTGSIEFLSDPIQLPLLQFEAAGWRVDRLVMRPTDVEIEPATIARNNDATSGVAIPINSSLWLSNPAERNSATTDASRPEGNSPAGIAAPTANANASDATADATTKIRLDFALSQPLASAQTDIAFALPRLSWLAQDSQQRIAKTIPGTLTLYSWLFRLQEPATPPEGWIPIAAGERIAPLLRTGSDHFSPFLLSYQIPEASAPAVWNGSRVRRPSSTAATYRASASVQRDAISIQHRWSCVSYGNRPSELRLGLPTKWLSNNVADGFASLRVDGQSVQYQLVEPDPVDSGSPATSTGSASETDPATQNAPTAIAESVPTDALQWIRFPIPNFANDGLYRTRFAVELTTDAPLVWDAQSWTAVAQSLPILAADHSVDVLVCDAATMTAAVSKGLILEPIDMQLDPSVDPPGPSENATAPRVWTLDPDAPRWSARVLASTASLEPLVMVEAQWVQTILNAIYQRDRYVVRFATNAEFVDLEILPSMRKDAEWLLDGQRANVADLPEETPNRVRVSLKDTPLSNSNTTLANAPPKTHVLEVFTLRPAQGGWLRKIELKPPRLDVATNACPLVWQIIVPRTEHLISSSNLLSPMYRWKWRDLFMVRASEYSQSQMEQSLGATHQAEVTLQTNQYDLCSMTGNASLETWFVPSSLIWFPIAITVWVLAALMTEKQWLRWPWAWVLLLCMAMLFSQWAWDISVIAAQAACVAILIALLYSLLRWLLDRRARRRSIFVSRSTTVTAANASRASAGSGSNLAIPESNSRSHPSGPALPAASGDSQ